MNSPAVILIGGTGRSGTNILKSIFAKHSRCATLPFEHRFTIDPEGIVDFYNTYPVFWSPFAADARIKRLEKFLLGLAELSTEKENRTARAKAMVDSGINITPPPYSGWELEKWIPGYSSFVSELIDNLTEFKYHARWPGSEEGIENNEMCFTGPKSKTELRLTLQGFLQSCHLAICKAQSKEMFVEDNTHNILFAKDLFELIPRAKLIHVVRDPRDVLASLSNQQWAPRRIHQAIRWYAEVSERWEVQKSQISKDDFFEIKLENLIEDPETQLTFLCRFLNLGFEKGMLEVEMDKTRIGTWKTHQSADLISNSSIVKLASSGLEYR